MKQIILDSPEVPEKVKSWMVPLADRESLEEIILKYKIPIHERIEEMKYKEQPGMVKMRKDILDESRERDIQQKKDTLDELREKNIQQQSKMKWTKRKGG